MIDYIYIYVCSDMFGKKSKFKFMQLSYDLTTITHCHQDSLLLRTRYLQGSLFCLCGGEGWWGMVRINIARIFLLPHEIFCVCGGEGRWWGVVLINIIRLFLLPLETLSREAVLIKAYMRGWCGSKSIKVEGVSWTPFKWQSLHEWNPAINQRFIKIREISQ